MNIVLINTVAEYGSTGKIVTILKNGYASCGHRVVCYYGSRGENDKRDGFVKITQQREAYFSALAYRITGYQGLFLSRATARLIRALEQQKPDVVHLMNIHGYYLDEFKLLRYLADKSVPVVYSMMDEYAYMGKCPFSYDCEKFKTECGTCPNKRTQYPVSWLFDRTKYYFRAKEKAYNAFSNITFVGTPWVIWRAKQSALLKNRNLAIINEPIDLDTYFYPKDVTALREELGIPEENIVILAIATLSSYNKGGVYFLHLFERMKEKKGYSFVYVGYDTEKYGSYEGLIKIPYVSSLEKLSEYCSLADVLVSTTMSDTIPNAAINALGSGTPVCGFDCGGLSFIGINDEEVVKLTPIYDIDALEKSVLKKHKKTPELVHKCRESVYDDYCPHTVVSQYIELMKKIIK